MASIRAVRPDTALWSSFLGPWTTVRYKRPTVSPEGNIGPSEAGRVVSEKMAAWRLKLRASHRRQMSACLLPRERAAEDR